MPDMPSSGTVHKTTPSMASYAAAKAALNALTRTLARDLARRGVRVNGVAPGLTKTDTTRSLWETDGGSAAGRNLILGRMTEATDIANAVVFLLSDDAAQITGVTIDVDGGNHLMGGWSPFATQPAVDMPAGS
jgi:3-oxoacyl-[acyl-carrier protein] reductase